MGRLSTGSTIRRRAQRGLLLTVAALLVAWPASAQSLRDRVRDRCLEVRSETACDDALGLLWPILVDLSAGRGDVLLRHDGQGTMSTPAFQNVSPELRIDWTVDASASVLGCAFALSLLPVAQPSAEPIYDPPWGLGGTLLSADVPAGEASAGTGYAHGVPLDQFFLRQDGLGGCSWTVTVTAE